MAEALSDSGRQGTILLVDDEPLIMTAVSRILVAAGFTVHTCGEWVEVPGLVRRISPDLILLDYNMPVLKGDDICQILKRNTINPGTKVVLFSSEDESFLAGARTRCGADDYIPKRTAPQALVERIDELLAC